MKKNIITAAILTLTLSAATVSCDDPDTTSYMPIYSGFQIAPAQPTAGETITFTAQQEKKGHLIYHADYRWNVVYATSDEEGRPDTVRTVKNTSVVYDMESGDPSVTFTIPKGRGGNIQATFIGEFRYSGVGAAGYDGTSYDGPGANGTIRWRSSSSTDGYCEGTTRKINVKASE